MSKTISRTATQNNGKGVKIRADQPYRVRIVVEGTAPILFHNYNPDVAQPSNDGVTPAKGSKSKKTDDVESYVYRDESGMLAIPALNFCMAMATAAKSYSDPRSPRKSARDLFVAGVVPSKMYGRFYREGVKQFKTWEFLDKRGACVQRNRINRTRPGLHEGWRVEFVLEVLAAEYISSELLNRAASDAGKFCAIGDFRPVFGRFHVIEFETLS